MSELFEYSKAVMESKDHQSLATLQAGLAKPLGEITTAYTRELQKLMVSASTEFTQASQARMADVQRGITTLMGSVAKGATSGTGFLLGSYNNRGLS